MILFLVAALPCPYPMWNVTLHRKRFEKEKKDKGKKQKSFRLFTKWIHFVLAIDFAFICVSLTVRKCVRGGGRTAMAHGIHGYVAIFIFFLSYFFCILNESLYPVSINQTTIIANMHEIKRFHVSGLSAYDYVATAIYILGTHCTHTHHTPYRSRMHWCCAP